MKTIKQLIEMTDTDIALMSLGHKWGTLFHLKSKSGKYDIEGGTKSGIGLVKTLERLVKEDGKGGLADKVDKKLKGDDRDNAIGDSWASVMKMKKNSKGRYDTKIGDKTGKGLYETLKRVVNEHPIFSF
jgi:hypothetical protein